MKIKIVTLSAIATLSIMLTGCMTTLVAGSLYNSIGWLFGSPEVTNDNYTEVIENLRIKYNEYCDTASEALIEFTDEVIESRTENVVSCLTDLETLFNEQGKRKFFAVLLANKLNNTGETDSLIENDSLTQITTTDIKNFAGDYFDYRVTVTSYINNNNITTYYADISIIKRNGLYNHLNFSQMDIDNAEYIESILINVL